MIYKRAAARLRAQDWLAITIEVGIVIVGVFIGTQVSNWNQGRLEKRETQRMVTQLDPQLQAMRNYFSTAREYYATTRAYTTTAIAGWRMGRPPPIKQRIVYFGSLPGPDRSRQHSQVRLPRTCPHRRRNPFPGPD